MSALSLQTLVASPLGESLATHLASDSLLKNASSPSHSSAPQCCKEFSPIRSASPPAEPFAITLRGHANGSTGGRLIPSPQMKSSTFAGNRYPQGPTAMGSLVVTCWPLGRSCPESHSRQRLPPSGAAPLREWLLPACEVRYGCQTVLNQNAKSAESASGRLAPPRTQWPPSRGFV